MKKRNIKYALASLAVVLGITGSVGLVIASPAPNLSTSTNSASDINGGIVAPGDTLRYTITIINSGDITGTGVSATSTIDTDTRSLSNVQRTNCGSSVNASSSTALNVSNITVAVGTNCVITFDVVVRTGANLTESTSITNTTTISAATQGGPGATPSSNTLTLDVTPVLTVTNRENDTDNIVTRNQLVSYTLEIQNTGDGPGSSIDAVGAIDSDAQLDTGSVNISGCGGATSSSTSSSLNISDITINTNQTCTIYYDVTVSGSAVNEATVLIAIDVTAAAEGSNDPLAASATTLTVDAAPQLSVQKQSSVSGSVTPGQTISYTVRIDNNGHGTGTTSFIDTIPTGFDAPQNVNFTNCGSPSDVYVAPSFVVQPITVLVGVQCVVSYDLTVNSGIGNGVDLTNTVDVSQSEEGGNDPGPASAPSLTSSVVPNLVVTKTENDVDNAIEAGDIVTYTITVENNGNGTGHGIGIFDTVTGAAFGSISNVTTSPECGLGLDDFSRLNLIDITSIDILAGQTCTVTYQVNVASGVTGGETLDNAVDVTPAVEGGNDPSVVNATQLMVSYPLLPSLFAAKYMMEPSAVITPGQVVTYRVYVANEGGATGTTSFTDVIDSNYSAPGSFTFSPDCGPSPSHAFVGSTLTVSNLVLDPDAECNVGYDVTVSPSITVGTTISNTADVAAAAEGGNNPSPVSSVDVVYSVTPNLTVESTHNQPDNELSPNEVATYTVTITNDGDGVANGVDFSDIFTGPVSGFSNFTFTNCGSGHSHSTSGLHINISALQISTSTPCVVTYDVTSDADALNDAIIHNSVDATAADEGGNNPSATSAPDITIINGVDDNADNDGIGAEIENDSPNGGDANNDGTNDADQPKVTSLVNPVSNRYAVLDASATNCTNNNSVSAGPESASSADGSYEYPVGLMNFTLTGCTSGSTVSITQYFYGNYDPTKFVARKFNSNNGTYTTISGAVLSSVTIGGQPALRIVYSITDGGELDQDGIANGTIVDPSGPALLAGTSGVGSGSAASNTGTRAPATGYDRQSYTNILVMSVIGAVLLSVVAITKRRRPFARKSTAA